jgi:hypothetical protein
MPIVPPSLTVISLDLDSQQMHIHLSDGRSIVVPYDVTPRLQHATPQQRRNWRFIGRGLGIHWEDIDEDLSIAGLVKNYAP